MLKFNPDRDIVFWKILIENVKAIIVYFCSSLLTLNMFIPFISIYSLFKDLFGFNVGFFYPIERYFSLVIAGTLADHNFINYIMGYICFS